MSTSCEVCPTDERARDGEYSLFMLEVLDDAHGTALSFFEEHFGVDRDIGITTFDISDIPMNLADATNRGP